MARLPSITFANLICRFGDRYVLLDLAEEVVLPALFDPDMRRPIATTEYLFLNMAWTSVDAEGERKEDLIVYGQFVKNTVLQREQILEAGRLVEDHGAMPSAPSAFFVLILSNHKLIYLPETAGAPTLEVFASTFQSFLRRKHEEYIRLQWTRARQNGEPVTKSSLYNETPVPTVEALPLASRDSIGSFINSIPTLTRLEFKLLPTNRETPMIGPYLKLREVVVDIRAKTTRVSYENPEGLDKPEAANQIDLAAASGNQAVSVTGKAVDGVTISGNNEKMRLHVPAVDLPLDRDRKAFALFQKFETLRLAGSIRLDRQEDTGERVAEIRTRLLGSENGLEQ